MVEVSVHENRVVFLQHVAERIGDPARKHTGKSRADADDLHVRDSAQAGNDPLEFAIAHHQRISAGKENVANLSVAADVVDPHRDGLLGYRAGSTDHSFASTETAVH